VNRPGQPKKSGRRGEHFGREFLPNPTGTCKCAWSNTARHFLSPKIAGKDSQGMSMGPS